jgi:hypothetical protein
MNDRQRLYNDVRGGCVLALEDKSTGKSFMYLTYIGARGRTYIQHVREGRSNIRLGHIFPSFTLQKKIANSRNERTRLLSVFYDCLVNNRPMPPFLEWAVINNNHTPNREPVFDDFDDGYENNSDVNNYLGRIGAL